MSSIAVLKLKISLASVLKVMTMWQYLLIAFVSLLFSMAVVLWSLNLELLRYVIIDSGVSISTKLNFFFSVYKDIFNNYEHLQAFVVIIFSVLFGINTALVVFVLKNQDLKSIPKKSGVAGLIFAIVGGGCLACGTSILYPVLITFGLTTSLVAQQLGVILSLIGSVLLLFSIYKLGGVASFVIKSKEQ